MERLLSAAAHDEFHHEAFFYWGPDEFLRGTASFIREGLAAGEPVFVLVSEPKIQALRSALGDAMDRVRFADIRVVGVNPARIIPAWREFVSENGSPGRRVRGIGEPISTDREPAELVECQRHEALLNVAFADASGFRLLCPYDTEVLAPVVLEEARRNHPFVASDGAPRPSPDYPGLAHLAAPCSDPLPDPPVEPEACVFQAGTLRALRVLVAARAAEAGLDDQATEDIVLAADEVATNSIVHGPGGGLLRIWREDGALVCELHDKGRIERPLAGRERPAAGQASGHGLWMANQLCDLVQIRSFAGGGVVRLHKRLPLAPA
jgi:anti-sigma regulatory factor (Ser/Thr protein kinase)